MKYINIIFLFGVFLFLVGFVLAYSSSIPNPGHGADEIFVYVNGNNLNLQSAIDSGEFDGNSYSGGSVSGNIVFGHDDVYVNVGGFEKSLQSAINDNSLCLFDGGAGVYSGVGNVGHSADSVLVDFNGERSLQATINQGLFAGKWDKTASDVCNGQSFIRSRCGASETGVGTKTTGSCAVCVASWSPTTDTVCSGTSFTQTSNCGTTRSAVGTKSCLPDYYGPGTFYAYLAGFPADTCDGKIDSWERFTCSPTDDMTCTDSWMQPWTNGDRHGESRTVVCRL